MIPGETGSSLVGDRSKRGRDGLWVRPLEGGKAGEPRDMSSVLDRLGINAPELDQVTMSLEGDLLAIVVNDRGYGKLHVLSLPSFEPIAMCWMPSPR